MSRDKLLAGGYCCGLSCLNCPYDPPHRKGNKTVRPMEKRIRLGPHSKGAKSTHWDLDYMPKKEVEKLFEKSEKKA